MSTLLEPNNLDLLMDVKVDVRVQLGSCEIPMKELFELTTGTVLQLREAIKDPVKLLINGKLAALGEVVVVDDHFGIKITELVNAKSTS